MIRLVEGDAAAVRIKSLRQGAGGKLRSGQRDGRRNHLVDGLAFVVSETWIAVGVQLDRPIRQLLKTLVRFVEHLPCCFCIHIQVYRHRRLARCFKCDVIFALNFCNAAAQNVRTQGNTNAEHEEIRIEKIPTISAGN